MSGGAQKRGAKTPRDRVTEARLLLEQWLLPAALVVSALFA